MSEKEEELLRDLEERIGIHESDSDKFHRDVKSYTLQVVREAVEDELESLDTAKIISTESELILCRVVAIRMLTRIESKLEES